MGHSSKYRPRQCLLQCIYFLSSVFLEGAGFQAEAASLDAHDIEHDIKALPAHSQLGW